MRKIPAGRISGTVAVAVVAIFLIWFGVADHDPIEANRTAVGSPGSFSDDSATNEKSESNAGSQAGSESDWPGLPSEVSGVDDVVSPLQPEPAEDELAPKMPLVELVDSFDELKAHQRGEVAYRIASGWMDCRGKQALDDAALRAEAERIVENRKRRLTEMAAHALEQNPGRGVVGDIEQAIEEFAQTSRDARVAEVERELRAGQNFCRGADNPGYDERNLRYVQWLERAADLGHPPARIGFARVAFFWSETVSVGEAAVLVERKRKVARYLQQALDQRNPEALLALAQITREGYYALPDSVLEYAYSRAAVRALTGNAAGWVSDTSAERGANDFNLSMLGGRIEKLEISLNPNDLRRAKRLSERLLGRGGS